MRETRLRHHRDDIVLTPMGVRYLGRLLPCSIGRGGLTADKREGDGATPFGRHRVVGMYFRPDRLSAPCDWATPIRLDDLWSDDPTMSNYNNLVRAPYSASHEKMRRADPLYDLVIVLDWNWPNAVPGRGSAIFMHQWRRRSYPTEGCIALAPKDLRWLAERIALGTRVLVPNRDQNR